MHENLNLKEKCQSFELMLSTDTIKLLHLLFVELNSCTHDLNEVVTNCIDIYKGKSIDISSLLGYSSHDDYGSQEFVNDINHASGLINNEYLLIKTNEIKKLKEKLGEVRKIVSDEYAERLGSNVSCITQ